MGIWPYYSFLTCFLGRYIIIGGLIHSSVLFIHTPVKLIIQILPLLFDAFNKGLLIAVLFIFNFLIGFQACNGLTYHRWMVYFRKFQCHLLSFLKTIAFGLRYLLGWLLKKNGAHMIQIKGFTQKPSIDYWHTDFLRSNTHDIRPNVRLVLFLIKLLSLI